MSHFIDGVFGSSEKGKILTLLKVILHNVWPHLQNHRSVHLYCSSFSRSPLIISHSFHSPSLNLYFPHSSEAQKLHHHSVKLLSSLSGFQATRKAWRRETFDLFMADNFFVMELESLQESVNVLTIDSWKVKVNLCVYLHIHSPN